MSVNDHDFVEWKEQFVSQERGNRVVHYFLKDSDGESFLAVVGTERSLRHMVYVVSDEFLQVCGHENSINTCFKWRSRREVVNWLTSLLSKKLRPQDCSKSAANDSAPSVADHPTSGINDQGNCHHNHMGDLARKLKGHNLDVVWSGAAWSCGKQLKHYQAFYRNGATIAINSFVLVMAKVESNYLAYLEDMYEDKKGQKKVKVRWFHQNQEVVGMIPPPAPHPREVFITPYTQVISVECVDGLATVLTPEHYEKCVAALPCASTGRLHLCSRQFHNNRVKPFNLSKLLGYFDQSILLCLDLYHVPRNKMVFHSLTEEDEDFDHGSDMKKGSKKIRSCRAHQRSAVAYSGIRYSGSVGQITAHGPAYRSLRFGLSSRRPLAVKYMGSSDASSPLFKVDEKIELLCQDSGIRGCWFRCTVLKVCQKKLKVQYDDVQNEDGCSNLEEWVPASRPAAPDKLGMRCLGRLTIRPCPPPGKLAKVAFEIGTPVDAWWNDGWWEGVVTGVDNSGDDTLQVYLPGENRFLTLERRNLRISRDWKDNQWVNIEPKRDILSVIFAVSPGTKFSACSALAKGAESGGSAVSVREVHANSEPDSVEEEKLALIGLDKITSELHENVKLGSPRKQKWDQGEAWEEDDDRNYDSGDGRKDSDNDDEDARLVMNKEVDLDVKLLMNKEEDICPPSEPIEVEGVVVAA